MKILAIIPARKESKRIQGKNWKTIGGKPLIKWCIESAIESRYLSRIVVSSDADEILSVAGSFPTISALRRPDFLCQDESPALDYVVHTLNELEKQFGESYEIIVIIQPTSPLTLPEDIDSTVRLLVSSKAQTSVSVVKLNHMTHPSKLKIMNGDRLEPFLYDEEGRTMAHELPEIFVRNCAVYATRIEVIKQGKIIGNDCVGYIMPPERSVDINEPIDFEFAEFLLRKRTSDQK